mgnify:CR=1 FL=1
MSAMAIRSYLAASPVQSGMRAMKFDYTGIRVRDLVSRGSKQRLELNYYPPGTKYFEGYADGSQLDHLAFWCKDVRRSYEATLKGGASPAVEPWDEGGYTLAFVKDPDGIWIELIGKKVKG